MKKLKMNKSLKYRMRRLAALGIIIYSLNLIFTLTLNLIKEEKRASTVNIVEATIPAGAPRIVEIKKRETYTTRMTSFWPGDECNTSTITASGKSTINFQVNNKGWYTWNGKIVVATANTRLGKTNQKVYKLYDEFDIEIDGQIYRAVVLDVCGACMRDNRIDLFTSNAASAKDTKVSIILD